MGARWGWGRGVRVSGMHPTGIASAELFGIPILNGLRPQGIASAEAFGIPLMNGFRPRGIASLEAFGVPVINGFRPQGIASAEAFGTPSVGVIPVDIWVVYYNDGLIGHLTNLADGAGALTLYDEFANNEWSDYDIYAGLLPMASGRLLMPTNKYSVSPEITAFGLSTDNAQSWTFDDVPADESIFIAMVDFDKLNPSSGWAVSDVSITGVSAQHDVTVYWTSDAGISWAKTILRTITQHGGTYWIGAAHGSQFCYVLVREDADATPTSVNFRFYKVLNDGTFTTQTYNSGSYGSIFNHPAYNARPNDGCVDPTDTDKVYFIGPADGSHIRGLWQLDWGANTLSIVQSQIVASGAMYRLFVTSTGTIIIPHSVGPPNAILRSTDHGASFTSIDISAFSIDDFQSFDLNIVEDTLSGLIVIGIGFGATVPHSFLYSADDGVTWHQSGTLGDTSDDVATMRAR